MSHDFDKQLLFELKLSAYLDFGFVLNLANDLLQYYKSTISYNVIISKGNNGQLIRTCFTRRWWWNVVDKDFGYDNVHLWWTQWSKKEYYVAQAKKGDQFTSIS